MAGRVLMISIKFWSLTCSAKCSNFKITQHYIHYHHKNKDLGWEAGYGGVMLLNQCKSLVVWFQLRL